MSDEQNPWRKQADLLVPAANFSAYLSSHARCVDAVALALAWAYEQGYAQGRLYEIERSRGEQGRNET